LGGAAGGVDQLAEPIDAACDVVPRDQADVVGLGGKVENPEIDQ